MVDRVISCSDVDTVTELYISQDNIFLDGGIMSPAGIIENLAQSCAARMGCRNMQKNEAIQIGYIGEIRKCDIFLTPSADDILVTYVHIIEEVMNITLAEVYSKVGDDMVASAQMKIALMDV